MTARATVFVIADTDGDDLVFYFLTPKTRLSRLFRLRGQAHRIHFNPYLVYKESIVDWLGGEPPKDLDILVATQSSGKLVPDPFNPHGETEGERLRS